MSEDRYVIDLGAGWREVTKAEWVRAERAAGFNNTMGQPDEPGTQAFNGRGIRGAILRPNSTSFYHVIGTKWADRPSSNTKRTPLDRAIAALKAVVSAFSNEGDGSAG